jgi:uncharacterized protein with FMN-binding domain
VRARALVLSILSSAAVLLVGWQLGAQEQASTSTDPSVSAASPAPVPNAAASTPSAAPTVAPSPSSSSADDPAADAAPAVTGASGTFTGTSTQTRYGEVQVQITVVSGKITDVTTPRLTGDDSRSVSINNRAAPVLRQRVLTAQSANVQSVSGATYTSEGYLSSLQSALDQAGL